MSDLAAEFGLLANQRRLTALLCLRDAQSAMELDKLADEVTERECGARPEAVPDAVRDRIRLSLYHVHVPKLSEAEIVRYDGDRGVVALNESAMDASLVIDAIFED